ncbi:MAG TPA: phosphoribosylaminoimidazolesuccinocarboxamide synthase, partial [Acidimicrobiia bacterium]|nr:phosphoribosylaminoimidazolesuccinocarboxamide synthase [Acidimicrobiia bacterium]
LGTSPPSFDKQYVRDHFDSVGWDHEPPPPPLPADVIAGTRARYIEAYERITQASFDQWYAPDGS